MDFGSGCINISCRVRKQSDLLLLKYERTHYRRLQAKYPDVCTAEDIEALFKPPQAIDLYFDVVFRATEWPTRDHSLKTLAKYLGFEWRDVHPSGAASIEWFDRWCRERDP